MTDYTLENSIISSIQRAKEKAAIELKFSTHEKPYNVLKKILNLEFERINCLHISHDNKKSLAYVKDIKIEKIDIETEEHNFNKTFLGSAFIMAGQPILKKRFVMAGSASGTSIASKYLSKMLPQKLPVRISGTTVVGRAIGRMVPYVGWTLLAIDVIEILIEYSEENDNKKGFGSGFGGGSFGGGGAGGRW